MGTVSQVNLLKETVKVRLEEQPEAPKCFHNCEICVVRNGKGSCPRAMCPLPGRAGQAAQDHPCGGAPPPVRQCGRRPQRPGRRPRRAGEARRGRERRSRGRGRRGRGGSRPSAESAAKSPPRRAGRLSPQAEAKGSSSVRPGRKSSPRRPPHHPRPPMGQRPFPPVRKRPHRRRYRGKPKGDRPQGPKPES
ncbi:hypothetical protein M5E87_07410 [Flavonifractor plautii]|nr:hypothetical protein M5E87_07410 [Flavonifractor plautii]